MSAAPPAPETHCRLCAETSATDRSISINNKTENSTELQSTLEFLNVDVSSSNTLPKSVCNGCFDMLNRIWTFHNQVRAAQEKLDAIYSVKTNDSEEIKVDVKIEPTDDIWVSVEPNPVLDDNNYHSPGLKSTVNENTSKSHVKTGENNEGTKLEPIVKKRLKDALNAHMTIDIDDEERPYKCNICGTAFRAKRTLKIHLMTHSKSKPFQCNICTKSFQFKMYLQRHEAVHTDNLPFKCSVCDKQFRTNRCLQIHLLQHTGQKPYKCEVCAMDFNNWSNRYRHMKRKHNVGPKKMEKIVVDCMSI